MCLLEICPIGDAVWWIARGRFLDQDAAKAELLAWEAYHFEPGAEWRSREPGEMTSEAYADAKAALQSALYAGRLAATGRTADHRPCEAIPAEWWARLAVNAMPSRRLEPEMLHSAFDQPYGYGRDNRTVRGVTVRRHDVLALWPRVAPDAGKKRGGRKPDPIWDVIEIDVLRRIDADGDEKLAAVEKIVAECLAERGREDASEATIRRHAKVFLDKYVDIRKSGDRNKLPPGEGS